MGSHREGAPGGQNLTLGRSRGWCSPHRRQHTNKESYRKSSHESLPTTVLIGTQEPPQAGTELPEGLAISPAHTRLGDFRALMNARGETSWEARYAAEIPAPSYKQGWMSPQ